MSLWKASANRKTALFFCFLPQTNVTDCYYIYLNSLSWFCTSLELIWFCRFSNVSIKGKFIFFWFSLSNRWMWAATMPPLHVFVSPLGSFTDTLLCWFLLEGRFMAGTVGWMSRRLLVMCVAMESLRFEGCLTVSILWKSSSRLIIKCPPYRDNNSYKN